MSITHTTDLETETPHHFPGMETVTRDDANGLASALKEAIPRRQITSASDTTRIRVSL